MGSFSQKILKKIQHVAFGDKVKIVKSYVPEKVKLYIEKNLLEELKYFQKKYAFKVEILSNKELIIPEYKIELLNKSKKLVNKLEHLENIISIKKTKIDFSKEKKEAKKSKKEIKKVKTKKNLRTLWVRRKKKLN